MKLTRRDLLRLGLAIPASLAAGCSLDVSFGGDEVTGKLLRSRAPLPDPFAQPLRVPPVLEPVRSDADADYYELTQRRGSVEILSGLTTEVWGYDGIFPGPTIEARAGRTAAVTFRNELPVPSVTHLHGGVTLAESDGYPTDLLDPSNEKQHVYPLQQRAATLWYHDHRMDFTGPQVYKGLAGFFIVREQEEVALPLPKSERDIPLMIADRAFDADGTLMYPSRDPSLMGEPGVENDYMEGVLGDVVLVNGMPFEVDRIDARCRLGDTEIWEIRGNTNHPFLIHLVHFQILERGGRRPAAHDAGWKDTVNLDDGEEVRVIARFDGYPGKYVFHCHNLEREDMMMMANFEVV